MNTDLLHRLIASPGVNSFGEVKSAPASHKETLDRAVAQAMDSGGFKAQPSPLSHPLVLSESMSRHHAGSLEWPALPKALGPHLLRQLEPLAHSLRIDLAFVPSGRRLSDFSVLAMDMDSTVITIECIDELAAFCGKKEEVAAITEATMRGEIKDFSESLLRRVAILGGIPETAIEAVIQNSLRFSPGAQELLQSSRAAGLQTVLVSGGFTPFASYVAQQLGFDHYRANTLGVESGRLTGTVLGEIVDGRIKQQTVEESCVLLGVNTDRAIVVGDGSNDLPMMSVAGLSVAYRAKPAVRAKAHCAIDFGRLDSILLGLCAPDMRR